MDQFTLNLIVVGLSFALYFGIAFWARAGSTAEFYAASQGVPPVMNGMATAADWMSAASFISMAGLIAFGGYTNSVFLMGWTGGYVLLALLLAPYLRKFGKFTVPEFVGDRFYSTSARMVAVVCLLVISITYVIGQMVGVGVTFARFLEVSTTTGLLIGSAVVFAYAVFGGMKGITYTQVAQYIVLIIAYTIPALFISLNLTGHILPQLGFIGGYAPTGGDVYFLDKLDQVVTDLGFTAYTADTTNMFNMFLITMSLMIGTAGLPHVIIRFFTVPKVADARSSAGWALVFIALLYTVAPAVGSMARLNITTTFWPGASFTSSAICCRVRPSTVGAVPSIFPFLSSSRITRPGSLRTSGDWSSTLHSTVWAPVATVVVSSVQLSPVAPAIVTPSSFQATSGLLPGGTMCENENACVFGTGTTRLVAAGDVLVIVSTAPLTILTTPSWQTRQSAWPRLRIRQFCFGR